MPHQTRDTGLTCKKGRNRVEVASQRDEFFCQDPTTKLSRAPIEVSTFERTERTRRSSAAVILNLFIEDSELTPNLRQYFAHQLLQILRKLRQAPLPDWTFGLIEVRKHNLIFHFNTIPISLITTRSLGFLSVHHIATDSISLGHHQTNADLILDHYTGK